MLDLLGCVVVPSLREALLCQLWWLQLPSSKQQRQQLQEGQHWESQLRAEAAMLDCQAKWASLPQYDLLATYGSDAWFARSASVPPSQLAGRSRRILEHLALPMWSDECCDQHNMSDLNDLLFAPSLVAAALVGPQID